MAMIGCRVEQMLVMCNLEGNKEYIWWKVQHGLAIMTYHAKFRVLGCGFVTVPDVEDSLTYRHYSKDAIACC